MLEGQVRHTLGLEELCEANDRRVVGPDPARQPLHGDPLPRRPDREPERAAQSMVDKGFTPSYTYALQTMQEVPYNRWREYDPEDTVRFYALRLHEAEMIKSIPQKIIVEGTDWRFFNELKKELKG